MSTVLESLSLGNGSGIFIESKQAEDEDVDQRLQEKAVGGEQGGLTRDAFPAVTQEEHPVLYRPFYMLHPCQTGAIMSVLKNSDNNIETVAEEEGKAVAALKYLLSWLCVAGQPVGIAPSPEEWIELSTRLNKS